MTSHKGLTVLNLQGRAFMQNTECPFRTADALLEGQGGPTIVDMHAEATSEKVAMGWYLDGRVSAVIGTHTHVPTADARLLPSGTAYVTDAGMAGAATASSASRYRPRIASSSPRCRRACRWRRRRPASSSTASSSRSTTGRATRFRSSA